MSQKNDTGQKAFTAGAAIAQHLRVKLSSAVLAVAAAADEDIGTITEASFASGDVRNVDLASKPGTCKMVCAGAVAAEAVVYGAAGGKIDDTANGNAIGIALEAGSGDGSVIEVLRGGNGTGVGAATTSAYGVVLQAAVDADITDSSGGTANATLEAMPAVNGSGATTAQEAAINNNFADLAADLNDLKAKLRTAGVLATS